MAVRVYTDTEALQAFGKALRTADKEIRRDLYRAVQRGTRDAKDEVKKSAVAILPHGGGMGEWTASLTVRTRQSYSGRSPGVTIVGGRNKKGKARTKKGRVSSFGKKADMNRMNAGRTAHGAWGHMPRRGLILQNVPAGFFDKAIEGPVADQVVREVYIALDKTLNKLL